MTNELQIIEIEEVKEDKDKIYLEYIVLENIDELLKRNQITIEDDIN